MDTNVIAKTELKPLKKRSIFQSPKIVPYIFVLPFLVTFAVFFLYPTISAIIMSFQHIIPGETTFVGLQNYRGLANPHFYRALFNSFVYTILTLILLIPIPLIIAVLLNSKFARFKNVFKSAFFVPALTSIVVAGIVFRLIFADQSSSLANSILLKFGIPSHQWAMNAGTGMFLMVILACWRWMGVNILYFLAGLQNISSELYESADIDGAGSFTKFWRITVPLLKPVTIYVLTISIFGGLSMFTESYMFWNSGMSPGDIGLTIVGYLYQQGFLNADFGTASASGIVLLVLVMVINLIQLKYFGVFRKED